MMRGRRSRGAAAVLAAILASGCANTVGNPTSGASAPAAAKPAITTNPFAVGPNQSLMASFGTTRWVFNGPTQLADTISASIPFDSWASCAKGNLGPAFNPTAPKPVTLISDAPTRNAMLVAVIPDATLVVMIKGFSATDSQATIYTTTQHADNAAHVKTAVAELRKCTTTL